MRHSVVQPICIPTPFAVGDVYSYLITDEKVVLVDCGHKSKEAFELIARQLAECNLAVENIDEIWLTHGHPDHFGQAHRLAEQSGAEVYGHPKERANFAGNEDGELFGKFFKRHEIPGRLIDMMVGQLDWLQQYQQPIQPGWIEEGESLSTGRMEFEVHHTPGHAPGHLTFYSEEEGIVFGGDVLLEHISTNALINFDPDTEQRNRSLLQYRESLKWIRGCRGTVYPGHGSFITEISKVVDNHLNDQRQRFKGIQKLLDRNPCSLFQLAKQMFPDALKDDAVFLVLSEVLGYLDWGMKEGVIEENDGVYSLGV